jgi:hypothetical protein
VTPANVGKAGTHFVKVTSTLATPPLACACVPATPATPEGAVSEKG